MPSADGQNRVVVAKTFRQVRPDRVVRGTSRRVAIRDLRPTVARRSCNDNPVLTIGAGHDTHVGRNQSPVEFSVGFGGAGSLVIAGTPTKRVTLTSLAPRRIWDWVGVEVWGSGCSQDQLCRHLLCWQRRRQRWRRPHCRERQLCRPDRVDHSSFTYSRGYGIYVDCAGPTVTPQTTVTLNAGITYAHNESDPTNTGDPSDNVGPGLNGPTVQSTTTTRTETGKGDPRRDRPLRAPCRHQLCLPPSSSESASARRPGWANWGRRAGSSCRSHRLLSWPSCGGTGRCCRETPDQAPSCSQPHTRPERPDSAELEMAVPWL